ncbi:hypothetical protein DFH09DRAFT_1078306 [Mycena vulgaris]|nr:hypothetical protein DFH09DRAFT_1078306 [Mycena vulgaris]
MASIRGSGKAGGNMHVYSKPLHPHPSAHLRSGARRGICDPALLGKNSANTVTERKGGQRSGARTDVPSVRIRPRRRPAHLHPVVNTESEDRGARTDRNASAPGDALNLDPGGGISMGGHTDAPGLRRDRHLARSGEAAGATRVRFARRHPRADAHGQAAADLRVAADRIRHSQIIMRDEGWTEE